MHSRFSAAVALVTAFAFTSAGCAARAWPTRYTAAADPTFVQHGIAVATVDILPVDLEIWATEERADEGPQVRANATATALGAIAASLARNGYQVSSMIDWYGRGAGAADTEQVMTGEAVLATAGALAAYGAAAARSPGLPVPYLPVRLGEHTGADATLYVGGWSYLGKKPDNVGEDIAMAALILIGIVVVVAVVAAIADGGKGHHGGGGHRGGPSEPGTSAPHLSRGGHHVHHEGLAVRAAGAIARTAVVTSRVALRTLARSGTVALRIGHDTAGALTEATFRGAYGPYPDEPSAHFQILIPSSCPDRGSCQAPVGSPPVTCDDDPGAPGCPSTVSAWRAPPRKGASSMYLEMTLVDNRTGRVLWHARQLFPADGALQADVQRAIAGLLSTLPKAP